MSTDANDTNTVVKLHVSNQDGTTSWIDGIVGFPGQKIYGLLEVSKPVTKGSLQLYAAPFVLRNSARRHLGTGSALPPIRVDQALPNGSPAAKSSPGAGPTPSPSPLTSSRSQTGKRSSPPASPSKPSTPLTGMTEPLPNKTHSGSWRKIKQPGTSIQRVSQAAETSPTLNLSINTRDAIIAGDLYDAACDIFGPIGQQKIFDRITEAVELLQNLSNWDATIGYVDIQTWDSFYVTLPQYVDQVLAINVNKSRGLFRNQWHEFHMNGLGQDNDYADAVGSNRPCGGWEEIGELPCAFPLQAPSYLVAAPVSPVDNGTPIRAYGIDPNDLPIYGTDGNLGVTVTCEQGSFDISGQQMPFKRIDRIVIGTPQSFLQLYATDGTQYLQSLGTFWPNVPEPRFRVIKIGQKAITVRLRYKKRLLKITSLTDPIHMRSRSAMLNAMRSIQTAVTDPTSAQVLMEAAKDLLNKEWRSTHPHEQLGLQVDPDTWGCSFPSMP